MTALSREDCLSVALFLDAREAQLCLALDQESEQTTRDAMLRELSEIRRLRHIFDTLSGRSLDFTCIART